MRETWWTSTQLIQCNAPKYDAMHVWLRAMTRCMLACGCVVVQPHCLMCQTSKNAKTKRVTLYSPCWSCSTSTSNHTKWWPQSNRCFLRLYGITGVYLQTQTCAVYMEHSCLNCRPFILSSECQKELYTTLHSTTLQLQLHNYTPLHSITLHHTTLHYTTLHYTTPTTLHFTQLHYNYNRNYTTTTQNYTPLHKITLHYTTLHYTTLHYTTLHYTTLHWMTLHHR